MLYFSIVFVGIIYIACLIGLNVIPHVKVKSIGFFALRGITIQTPSNTIKVKKISLRMNVLRGKSSPLKLFNFSLHGVEIDIRNQTESTDKVSSPNSTDESPRDITEFLSIVLPKGFYDLLFYYQILNQFHIMIYQFTMYHERFNKNSKFYFDYAKIENALRYDGHNSLSLLLLNGYLHEIEDHERIQLFRNVEVILSCDAIFNCLVNDAKKIQVDLMNFELSVSLGKGHIPIDHLHIVKIPKNVEKTQKCHPISKNKLKQIKGIWKLIQELKITLEEFTLSLGPYVLKIASLQVSLDHSKPNGQETSPSAKVVLNITNMNVHEADTACFSLPAGSFVVEANPFALLEGLENSHNNELITNISQQLDLRIDITLTKPSIDLYHDQILYFEIKKATKAPRVRNNHVNIMNILVALRNVSTKFVIIGTQVQVHIPPLGEKEFHRESSLNVLTIYSIDSITQKFATKNLAKSILEQGKVKQQLYGLFKIKNLKAEFIDNVLYVSKCNLLTTYNIKEQDISLKLNVKHVKLKSINNAIFQLVREVRNRRIRVDNEVYNLMVCSKASITTNDENEPVEKYVDLFKVVPQIINRFKIEINEVQADIICKDGLPLQIYTDPETGEQFDLKDYARGVSLKLGHASVSFKGVEEEINVSIRSLNCFTLSEFDLDYLYDFDVVSLYANIKDDFSDISSIESIILTEEEHEDNLKQVKKVLDIEEIEISNNKQRDKNRLQVKIPEVSGRIDIFLIWCSIYAASLAKTFAPTEERLCSKQEIKSLMGENEKVLKMDISIPVVTLVTRFPNRVDVLSEFDSLYVRNVFEGRSIEFAYFRGFIVHPITKIWARFLTFKNAFFAVNATVEDENALELVSKAVRLNIPHGFLFYKVVDNIVTFGKAIQQIQHNFGNFLQGNMDFKALPQKARGPLKLPKVNIKSEIFALTLENDPFENELSYIIELGLVEQKIRLKKYAAFDDKVKDIMDNTVELKIKLSDKAVPLPNGSSSHPSFFNAFKGNHSSKKRNGVTNNINLSESIESSMLLSEEEAKEKIDHARDLLEEEISESWILKYKRFRSVKIKNWKTKSEVVWGKEKISSKVTEKFDIMNYLPGPLLLGLVFKKLDLTVSESTIPNLDKFLHDYGKGQPKLDYSILAPLYLDIKSAAVFSFLKDYSIPLVSFPFSDIPGKSAFHLSGNIVINEKLIHREEEMRKIWVPFSPPMAPDLDSDSFYYVTVRRTLTPVKFMVDLNCKIDSERATMISWCKSYQAALLAAMSAVDSFTKPKIDDSPIGWWDKLSLILHGQMTFDVPNELCFHMKSSTNPYDLTGRNAGFVFCWKNNVILKVDGMRSSKELITLKSDDFMLAIPNYSVAEKKSWSLFYEEMSDDITDDDSEAKKYSKRVMSLSSDEKVQWTLGLLFERNKNNSSVLSDKEKRTDSFLPHYDVVVTSPLFEWHPDSYAGFRSDYLHLAITVKSVSSKGNAFNSLRLTPLTFRYFFYWWNTITEAISLPVRQGNLFTQYPTDNNSHSKTSTHLFTVKYQIILEPLKISHTIAHSSGEKNKNIAFSGLKGKVSRCVLDLHQRKELLTYVNKKLDIENKILHLKMNQGEISFENADVRFVNAIFADKSMHSQLDTYLTGAETTDSSSGDSHLNPRNTGYLKWLNNVDIQGGDFSWFDPEDFTELEMRELLSPYPKVTIIPFFFTPQFSYVREFSLQEAGPFPFGNEDSHDCELGKVKPEDIQDGLLKNRINVLKKDIVEQKDLLKNFDEADGLDQSIKFQKVKVRAYLKELEDRLDLLDDVYETTVGLSDSESETEESTEMISRLESRKLVLSAYSSHRSFEEARKQGLLHKEVSEFHNRFIVHNLQIKWGNKLRDLFLKYVLVLGESRSQAYFMSKKAVDLVESVINSVPEEVQTDFSISQAFCEETKQGKEIVEDFDDYLDEVDNETQEAEHKFLMKLINPQIQLISDKDPQSVVLLVSKDLEMRTIAVNLKGVSQLINADDDINGLVESRYGGLFNDSSIYVFKRDDVAISHANVPYGFVDGKIAVSWPPWVETEAIYDETWTKDFLVCERTSMGLTFKKPNDLYLDSAAVTAKNELKTHIGKMVIRADSQQYSSLYYMITDLILHGKSNKDSVQEKLEKIIALSDNDDFYGLDKRVLALQTSIREFQDLLLKVDNKVMRLNPLERSQIHQLELELEKNKMELSMIMKGLKLRNTKSSNKRAARSWLLSSDQIIWHFLTAERKPLIDLALAHSKFNRVDSVDGSNNNKVEVGIIQGFNLQESSVYPELLSPLDDNKDNKNPVILMSWKMLNPVGGIPIMQQAKLKVQPLKIQLDYQTAKVLFDYAFPKDEISASQKKSNKSAGHSKTHRILKDSFHEHSFDSKDSSFIDELEGEISFGDIGLERKNIFKNWRKPSPSSLSSVHEETEDSSISSKRNSSFSSRFSSSEDLSSPISETFVEAKNSLVKVNKKKAKKEDTDDIALIMSRSSKYLSIVDIEVETFKLIISFKAPKHLNIIDVHNLLLNIPKIHYQNKTWSGEDFILHLRKDITKIILQHTGQIIGNKFKMRKRASLKEPLKQLSNYASFVTVQELQHPTESTNRQMASGVNGYKHPHRNNHKHIHHSAANRENNGNITLKVPPSQETTSFENLLQEIINEEDEQDSSSVDKTN